jgi:hypothetical protein
MDMPATRAGTHFPGTMSHQNQSTEHVMRFTDIEVSGNHSLVRFFCLFQVTITVHLLSLQKWNGCQMCSSNITRFSMQACGIWESLMKLLFQLLWL